MKLYNRRNFLKFLAKGAAIAGAAGVLGLPDVQAKEEYKDILAGKDDGIYFSSNGDIIELGTFDIPKGFPDGSYPVKFESGYVPAWTTEQRKRFAREVIEMEKQLPGLMPMWKDGHLFDALNYAAQGLENLEISAHKASKAMQKFNSTIEENELNELISNS